MATRLSGLQIDEVSLVKRAANGRKRFLILKADGQGEDMKIDEVKALAAIQQIEKDDMGPELEALAAADPVELKTVVAKAGELSADENRKVRAAFRVLGKALVEKFVQLLTPAKSTGTPVVGVPGVIRKADGTYDLSGVPEESRTIVKSLLDRMDADRAEADARIKKTEEVTKALVDAREKERFIAVVKSFDQLPGMNPDDLAPHLREIAEKCPAAYEKMVAVLKATNDAIAELDIDGVVGSSAAAATQEPVDEITKLAKAKVEKAEKAGQKLSLADAMIDVARENPELYRQHKASVREANSGITEA